MDFGQGLDTDMGGKYVQQARSLSVNSDGWIRGHHIPTALEGARTAARTADAAQTRQAVVNYYEKLMAVEREIELYYHRLAQLRIRLGRYADEVKADIDGWQQDKPYTSEWSVLAPDMDEETWLAANRRLFGHR